MMKRAKKYVAILLAVIMVVVQIIPSTSFKAMAATSEEIIDLKVDNIENPIGIDNTTPIFSWKMQSETIGQKQTAYELTVSTDKTFADEGAVVWNTGKVESDKSIDIAYAGDPLQSSTAYYWNVKVWDKNGGTLFSTKTASFEMGLLGKGAWDDAEWIRVPKSSDSTTPVTADLSKYTIDVDFKMQDAIGLVFAGTDTSHFFMWQFNNHMENGVTGTWLRPHRWNGGAALFNPENLPEYKGYQLPVDLVSGTDYKLTLVVDVKAATVESFINGVSVNKLACGNVDLSYGKLGFRQSKNTAQNINEQAWVNDIKVTANDSTTVFCEDFSLASDTQFAGGTVTDGRLYVSCENTTDVAADKVTLQKDSPNYYRLDADFTIKSGKAGIIYGANQAGTQYYYSTIDPDYSGGPTVVQSIHYTAGNENYGFDRGAITGITKENLVNQKHHITVTANPSGSVNQVSVYIDGAEVKNHDNLDGFAYDGKIGFVSQAGSDVTYDNVSVKLNGMPKVYSDFSTAQNIFDGGTIKDGALNVIDASVIKTTGTIGATAPKAYVRYDIDTDMTLTGDAIGILFSAEDSNNMYMWQFNVVDHKDSSGNGLLYLRPHIWTNGTPNYSGYERNINSYFTADQMVNTQRHIKLEVSNDAIKTYIDDTLVDTFANSDAIDGKVGFRSGAAGETGNFDNFKVTAYDEEGNETVKHDYNFDDNRNPFTSGKIVDGQLQVGSNDGAFFLKNDTGTPMFRKTFDTQSDIVSAKAYATSLGVYDLYLNGQRVGHKDIDSDEIKYDEMKPGWTDYNERVLYYTYDVTDLIKSNQTNAIGAMVGTGWWTGRISHNTYGYKDVAFMAKIVITYANGEKQVINTDQTWKTTVGGPIRSNDIYDGETYNANDEDPTWSTDAYDDQNWETPAISTDFKGTVSAQIGPTIQVRDELERSPQSVTVYEGTTATSTKYGEINVVANPKPGEAFTLKSGQTAIFDLGQNMVGWPKITVKGQQNTEVTIHFGEMLNDTGDTARGNDGPAGSIYMANYRSAKSTGTYILKGAADGESYRPTFTFYGFRYVQITATEDVEITGLVAQVLGSVNDETGAIETSSKDINQLYSNVLWGQRSNYLSVPTDCPQRDERLGWTGDTQIFSAAASYNANVDGFFQKWVQDASDSQTSAGTGAYTDVIPGSAWVGQGNAAWSDAGIIVPYNMYKQYGDTRIIKDALDSMAYYMDWLGTTKLEGANLAYGDWLSYEATDSRLIAIAYYAQDAQMMAEMCAAIGETEKAKTYSDLYGQIKAHFQSKYVNVDGTMNQTSQTAYLMALKMDLLPTEASKTAAKAALVQKIKNNGDKLSTGFIGTGTITQTLSDINESNTAYNLLFQRANPSWLYSVDQGATTIWERWNSYTKESGFGDVAMNSFNHYSYGAVAEWMYRNMAGIQADTSNPGYKHIILKPQPDTRTAAEIPENEYKMNWIKASYDSSYGTIKSSWDTTQGVFDYNTTVPANTTATLSMPLIDKNSNGVTINGTDYYTFDQLKSGACKTDGVNFVSTDGKTAVFDLLSGSYRFTEGIVTPDKTITSFNRLDASVKTQKVANGTSYHSLKLPISLQATIDGKSETVDHITWSSKPAYLATTAGTYLFTANLPSGYVLAQGVDLPSITVVVAKKANNNSHHTDSSSTTQTPKGNSTVTTTTNAQGGTVATVTTKPDTTPVVTGSRAAVSVTVPAEVASAIASATAEKPAEVKIAAPTDSITEQLKNSAVKSVDLTIQVPAAVANNTNSNAKTSISVDSSVLQAAKDAQKDLTLAVTNSDTGKQIYSWTFSGTDLKNSVASVTGVNLALDVVPVKNDAAASAVVANNTADRQTPGVVLKFGHHGLLPGIATVKVYVGDQAGCTPNSKVFLYYLNSTTQALEQLPQGEYTVDAYGYVTVKISHCSDYVILPKAATNPYPVKSDTSFPVGVKNGKTYTFAMTVSGKAVPSFAVGNGKAFSSTVKQAGNKYYFTVKAVGTAGTMTAVYSALPGQKPVVLCYIAVVQ